MEALLKYHVLSMVDDMEHFVLCVRISHYNMLGLEWQLPLKTTFPVALVVDLCRRLCWCFSMTHRVWHFRKSRTPQLLRIKSFAEHFNHWLAEKFASWTRFGTSFFCCNCVRHAYSLVLRLQECFVFALVNSLKYETYDWFLTQNSSCIWAICHVREIKFCITTRHLWKSSVKLWLGLDALLVCLAS